MALHITTKDIWERYGVVVWFPRFARISRTTFSTVAFLTLFVSFMSSAPFIYFTMQSGYELLNHMLVWVAFVVAYVLSIFLIQNLLWLLIRGILWLLEEL